MASRESSSIPVTSTSGRWWSTNPATCLPRPATKGIIYKITPDGQGTIFYKTNAGNVVSLVLKAAGDLIAGTESPGRVFRIDPAGKAFVLLDSPFRKSTPCGSPTTAPSTPPR